MRRAVITVVLAIGALFFVGSSLASAAVTQPLFVYRPEPTEPPFIPPPAAQLESPCGLAVDSAGHFYVSDHYHGVVDAFGSPSEGLPSYINQTSASDPCQIAVDSAARFYIGNLHGALRRYPFFNGGEGTVIDPGPTTGVAVNPFTKDVYVDDGDHVSVYEKTGDPVEVGGIPLLIGEGSLEAGYGIAVSGYPPTAGRLYVPDAATDTVKVYDPSANTEDPIGAITKPSGGFSSLTDSAVAVDDETGEIYVADDLQPQLADRPEAAIYVFEPNGAYEGRLPLNIIDARPPGLAVDNSETETQGRVYITSGNTENSSVIAYPPGAATAVALPPPEEPTAGPPGGCACGVLPEPQPPVTCEGDSCQHLPSEPTDPTLNTLVEGAANPPVRFHDTNRLAHYQRLRHHHHGKARHKAKRHRGGSR